MTDVQGSFQLFFPFNFFAICISPELSILNCPFLNQSFPYAEFLELLGFFVFVFYYFKLKSLSDLSLARISSQSMVIFPFVFFFLIVPFAEKKYINKSIDTQLTNAFHKRPFGAIPKTG